MTSSSSTSSSTSTECITLPFPLPLDLRIPCIHISAPSKPVPSTSIHSFSTIPTASISTIFSQSSSTSTSIVWSTRTFPPNSLSISTASGLSGTSSNSISSTGSTTSTTLTATIPIFTSSTSAPGDFKGVSLSGFGSAPSAPSSTLTSPESVAAAQRKATTEKIAGPVLGVAVGLILIVIVRRLYKKRRSNRDGILHSYVRNPEASSRWHHIDDVTSRSRTAAYPDSFFSISS